MDKSPAPYRFLKIENMRPDVWDEFYQDLKAKSDQQNQIKSYKDSFGELKIQELTKEECFIREKLSEAEKKKRKRAYTQEYQSREDVKERRRKREQDQEWKKAREEYSKLPEVQERKQKCTKERRQILRHIQNEHPEIFSQAANAIGRKTIARRVRRKKEKEEKQMEKELDQITQHQEMNLDTTESESEI